MSKISFKLIHDQKCKKKLTPSSYALHTKNIIVKNGLRTRIYKKIESFYKNVLQTIRSVQVITTSIIQRRVPTSPDNGQ